MTRTRRKTAACSRKVANALGSCAGSFGMGSRMLKRRLRMRHARSRKCETSREKLGIREGVLQDERRRLARVDDAPAPSLLPPSLHGVDALAQLRQRC
jgi:hypothetical protein